MDNCNICYLSVDPSTYYPCPECNNSFHKDHFAAWVFENQSCPICRRKLVVKVLTELAPKTEDEAQKMIELNRELARSARLANMYDKKFERKRKKQMKRKLREEMRQSAQKKSFLSGYRLIIVFVIWMGIGYYLSTIL